MTAETVDRILIWLARAVILCAGLLLVGYLAGQVAEGPPSGLREARRIVAWLTLGLSLALAGANRVLTEHPLFEYWAVTLVGLVAGILVLS